MQFTSEWRKRTLVVAAGVAVTLGVASTPALAAIYYSTTGAKGDAVHVSNTSQGLLVYDLYATDTVSDGHCAQWQKRTDGGAWAWIGTDSCGARKKVASGTGHLNWQYRICRTGVGNCSAGSELP